MIMLLCSVLSVEADDRMALRKDDKGQNAVKGSFSINYADDGDYDHSQVLDNNFYLFTDKDGSSNIYLLNLEKGSPDFLEKIIEWRL